MKRREFIGLIGCAVAWPLVARAVPAFGVKRVDSMQDYDAINLLKFAVS